MKTQIIRRIFLAVIALLICTHNNINTAQTDKKAAAKNTATTTVITKDVSNSASLSCIYCTDEHAIPAIPEANGDHEFHYFHVNHTKRNLLKTVANKIIELIYYLIVLIVYMPFKH